MTPMRDEHAALTATPGRDRVGFIGLGNMGRPMARNVARGGYAVAVHDLEQRAAQLFADEIGATAVPSLAELATTCQFIITMLPNGDAVRAVLTGNGERPFTELRQLAPGGAVIDMSSSDPSGAVTLSAQLAEAGITFLDAPVSGGVKGAEAATLAIVAGGPAPAVRRCKPLLATMGSKVFYAGSTGSGHALKALNNVLSAANVFMTTEVLLVGARFGLDPSVMLETINAATGRNHATETKIEQLVLSKSYASGFALDLMLKDLRTAQRLAHSTGTPTPLSGLLTELWALAGSELPPGTDQMRVVEWLERSTGTSLAGTVGRATEEPPGES